MLLAGTADTTITAYATDRILAEETNEQSDRLISFAEPTPESVGPLLEYTQNIPIQKMLVMDDVARTDELRPLLVQALDGRAEITVAIPGMLEVSRLTTPLPLPWKLSDHLTPSMLLLS